MVESKRRRARVVVALCVGGVGTLAAFLGVAVWRGEFDARWQAARVEKALGDGIPPRGDRRWIVVEGAVRALIELEKPAAKRYLERYARRPELGRARDASLRGLVRYHPKSSIARGVADYEQMTGARYFGRQWAHNRSWITPLAAEPRDLPRFESWLERYRNHPGRDDVLVRIAATHLANGDALTAARRLYEALHAPDGDLERRVRVNLRFLLDRFASAEDLETWLETDCPESLEELVRYSAALHRARDRRYAKARELLAVVRERLAAGSSDLLAWIDPGFEHRRVPSSNSPGRGQTVAESVEALDRALGELDIAEREYRAVSDSEAAAKKLHELARRFFREPGMFHSVVVVRQPQRYRQPGGTDLAGWLDGLPRDCGYRIASQYFRELDERYPEYEDRDKVAYSIPLCYWRALRSYYSDWIERTSDPVLARAFEDFAERFPSSPLADDAIYCASTVYAPYSDHRDSESAALRRLVEKYPDGDMVPLYAKSNGRLRRVIAEIEPPQGAEGESTHAREAGGHVVTDEADEPAESD